MELVLITQTYVTMTDLIKIQQDPLKLRNTPE